ncbi:MAG: alpha-amylase family glycosyl hydrolase [Bacteroidales bacterium]|nr:alpha-amylase family glycosyl hydrolase [Bacteroidales bacterium]
MRVFSATGNFAGVRARLDSIHLLGANIVYLMPIFPVGKVNSVNSPYCVSNYNTINPEFGTLTDLRTLVDEAHSKNMAVILDWVANHTAWDNPWIVLHKNWYLQNSSGSIVSPPSTGWNDVAQLNFNNADMRLEMIKSMKNWVYNANIDGFRCDFADGPPVDFWKQAIDSLRNIKTHKLLMLAEGKRRQNFDVGFDFNFGFSFFDALKGIFASSNPALNIDNLNLSEYSGALSTQQIVRYTTNHDVNGSDGTPLDLFGGKEGSMSAFVVVALMKSVPMIYGGQEVGLPYKLPFPFTGKKIDWSLNPDITAEYKRIISVRNKYNAIRRGTSTSYSTSDICAFTKESVTEKLFIVCNLRSSQKTFTLPSSLTNSNWTNEMTNSTLNLTSSITLPPFGYLILKKQ